MKISGALPQFNNIAKLCDNRTCFTAQLRTYVENVYQDLFGLFRAIANVFTSEDGGMCC